MNNLRAVYIIWYRDLLRFWNDKTRFIGSLITPFFFLVIFGTGIGSALAGQFGDGTMDYKQFMYPGILGMVVLMNATMSGMSIVWDREFGFLKEVLVAPISRSAVAIGKALGGTTIATAQGVLMLVFIPYVGVNVSAAGIFTLIAVMFVFAMSVTSLGILIASRIRSIEAFQLVMQLMLFPLLFLSPALFPAGTLPPWLGIIVKMNPVSYGIDAMRQAVLGVEQTAMFGLELFGYRMPIILNLAVLAAFGAIMAALAVRSFRTQE